MRALFLPILQRSLLVFTIVFTLCLPQWSSAKEHIYYPLPHPGILPDHPLYILKVVRDRMIDLTTRDPINKIELYLLYADKRAEMALRLAENGKPELAISTISKAEKYALSIIPILHEWEKKAIQFLQIL